MTLNSGLEFFKYSSNGNDFIIIDDRNNKFPSQNNLLIQRLCHRNFSIGADGLILLKNSKSNDFRMQFFNSDGFEADMCGNGLLSFTKYIHGNIYQKNSYFIETKAGLYNSVVEEDTISFFSKYPKILKENIKIEIDDFSFQLDLLNSGVAHGVILVNNIDKIDVVTLGKQIRYLKNINSKGINVNFCEPLNSGEFFVRTYEKGVENETLCCSTGAIATAMALNKKLEIKMIRSI